MHPETGSSHGLRRAGFPKMPNTATDPATSHSPFPSLSANGSRECAERSPLQPLPVIARLDRAIQYSRDASDRAEKPRRTGRLHSWAMTQRTWHAPSGSLRAQRSNPSSRAKGGMDCFVARAPRNDVERDAPSHPRGTNARGLNVVPLDEREQGTPGARCTRGLVCKMHKEKRTRAYRFSGGNPAFPAQGGQPT